MKSLETTYRPPVVAILGHVDHGKSTLLDAVLKTNIVEQEVGSITQRISAYEIIHKTSEGKEQKITFLDTPGHSAFQHMRAHGAELADVAILVVSAEDGVKQQTKEALKAIKEGNIPYVVAINKIDKPNADIERTKRTLLENEIYLEGLGGDIPYANISAKQNENIDHLLDLVILSAELEEYKGDRKKMGEGFIIESHIDKGTGVTTDLLIKNGTVKTGEYIVSGKCFAKIRTIKDYANKEIKEASFSSPVTIGGFNDTPTPGSKFEVYSTLKEAKERTQKAKLKENEERLSAKVEEIDKPIKVSIVLKVGVHGLLEAVEQELNKLANDVVHIKIVQKGVGNISENDIEIVRRDAHALIVGFQTSIDELAVAALSNANPPIPYKNFDIIYKLSEWVEEQITNYIKNTIGITTGKASIIAYFSSKKNTHLVGIKLNEGNISKNQKVRIIRDGEIIEEGLILSLQKKKSDIDKIETKGSEIGIQLKTPREVMKGDNLEAFI